MSPACPEPLGLATLVDYWFGDLDGPEEERAEEHLLGCGACSDELAALVATGEGVRRLASAGAFHVVIGPSFLDAASRRGLHIREYAVSPGESVACTVTPQDDLVVARLRADLREVARLDLVSSVDGGPEARAADLPVDPSSGELIVAEAMGPLRALGRATIRMRLVAPEGDRDRVLGEYTFVHSPS